jgi:hypothetical protein
MNKTSQEWAKQEEDNKKPSSGKFCGLRNVEAKLTKKVCKPSSQYASTKV